MRLHSLRMLSWLSLLLAASGCNAQGYALVTTVGAHPELESFTSDDSLADTKVVVLGDKLDCGTLEPRGLDGSSCADWTWRLQIFVPPAFQRRGDFDVGAEDMGQELLVNTETCKDDFGSYISGRISVLDASAFSIDMELPDVGLQYSDFNGKYVPVVCK